MWTDLSKTGRSSSESTSSVRLKQISLLQILNNLQFSFVQARCDVIKTATYKVSVDNLMKCYHLSNEQAEKVMYDSVKIARNVVGQFDLQSTFKIKFLIYSNLEEEKAQCYVAATIGPYGAMLNNGSEYNGWYTDSMTIEVLCLLLDSSQIL